MPTLSGLWEGNIVICVHGEWITDLTESKTLCMYGNFKRENREIPLVSNSSLPQAGTSGTVRKHHRWYR